MGSGCLAEHCFTLYLTQMDYLRVPVEIKSLLEVTWEQKQN